MGQEAAAEIEKQVEVVNQQELTAYISAIGNRLAAQPQADRYPYTFKVVNDKSINAFALPGGPAFVHTGLIAAVDNESQSAGVLAHEIVHVALRHGTNQVSKANLIQLPAMLASQALGSRSILGQLGQLGIGLGANSLLLKFSRTAETQADLLGAQIAAQAQGAAAPAGVSLPESRPPGRLEPYQGKEFRLSYPDNWRPAPSEDSSSVLIAPPSGVQQGQNGASVGYGVIVSYYRPQASDSSLWQATDELVSHLRSADPRMRAAREMPREIRVGGKSGIITALQSDSIFPGQIELDRLVTVARPNGLLYLVLIAPESERQYVDRVFEQILQSIQFSF